MTVSISKMSITYYLEHAATGDGVSGDLTSYYTEAKAPPGHWLGSGLSGLAGLSVGQEVTESAARSIFEKVEDPVTGRSMGRALMKSKTAPDGAVTPSGHAAKRDREGVAGFDLTFSPPKSVSAVWALAGPELQGRLYAAHRQAMLETVEWVEANVIQSRAGHGGVAHVDVAGVIASAFDHWDSRAGDPQLHTHLVISNRVQRVSDQSWVTLDSYTLHRHVVAISEMYNSLLFDRLAETAGTVAESRTDVDLDINTLIEQAEGGHPSGEYEPPNRVELAGVPDELIEEFSNRSVLIRQRKDELIATFIDEYGRQPTAREVLVIRQQATLENRPDKDTIENVTLPEKLSWWRQRTIDSGIDPESVVRNAVGHQVRTVTADMVTDPVRDRLASWALTDASLRRTTFTRANVRASAERVLRLVRCPTATDRQELVDQVVAEALAKAVSLTPDRSIAPDGPDTTVAAGDRSVFDHQEHAGVYTTEAVMTDEDHLISRVTETGAPNLSSHPEHVRTLENWRTADGHALSPDQLAAAKDVLASEAGISAVIGPAGTGKSTTMGAMSATWHSVHGPGTVIGLAPSAVAAGVLGDEIGVETDNVAKWLFESVGEGAARRAARVADQEQRLDDLTAQLSKIPHHRRTNLVKVIEALQVKLAADYAAQAQYTFQSDQLIIIDEASMVSTANLAEISRQAERAGAKILLVGDPAQLEAVDAGGFLGHVERHLEHSKLDMIWRFRNEWEKAASLKLRDGDVDVVDQYAEEGRIHGHPDTDATDSAYLAWKADVGRGRESILIASDNQTVAELNARAHADRAEAGEVNVEHTVTLRADVAAGIGDIVLARRNDRSLRDSDGAFVANGTRLTITDIRPDGSAVASVHSGAESMPSIVLDADYLASSVELGYATTAHRSQGVTVDSGHCVVTPKLSRELFYVAMTRGKDGNHAYVDFDDPGSPTPEDWRMQLTAQTLDDEGEVLDDPSFYIKSVVARSTAERSAHEVRDAELGWANDVGRLCHEASYMGWAAKLTQTRQWLDDTLSEDARVEVMASPQWQQLIHADPARTHNGVLVGDVSVESIVEQCQKPDPPSTTGPAGMVVAVDPDTPEQYRIWEQLQADLVDQVAARRAVLERDQPDWYVALTHEYPDSANRREVVDAAIIWRAVSDQTEADTFAGKEPPHGDYLRPYWDRLHVAVTAQAAPRPEDIDIGQDPMDLPAVDRIDWISAQPRSDWPAPRPLHQSTSETERYTASAGASGPSTEAGLDR